MNSTAKRSPEATPQCHPACTEQCAMNLDTGCSSHTGRLFKIVMSTVRPQTNRNVRELPVIIFLTRGVPTTRSSRPASVLLKRTLTCDECSGAERWCELNRAQAPCWHATM